MSSVKENQSVRNACVLIEAIAAAQPIGVSDLARRTGIEKTAAHRVAVTLHRAGWLSKTTEGRWRIAPALAALVTSAGTDSLIETVDLLLRQLRDSTGETAMLVVPEGDRLRIVAVAESRHNLRVTASVGAEMPARRSSALRALAAHFTEPELERWRAIDPELTDKALSTIRTRGWSVNDAELIPESRAVGAALVRPDGTSLAALVLCGPSSRFVRDDVSRYGPLVASSAAEWQAANTEVGVAP